MDERLPWDIVETLPSTDGPTVAHWQDRVERARDDRAGVRARVGLALALYWAVQEGLDDDHGAVAARRHALISDALRRARRLEDPTVLAEALLGRLYANWGPDQLLVRAPVIDELVTLRDRVADDELRGRIDEWPIIDALDRGAFGEARPLVRRFRDAVAGTGMVPLRRRAELWHANLAMSEGAIERALELNQRAVAQTSATAGSPFSFQNAAVTVAIERFFRRRLGDVVESIRSIRASSPRVQVNWTVGLAFALAESGRTSEASALYEPIARTSFRTVPRDLNWLVTMHLAGLVALRLDDRPRFALLLDQLRPYAHLDASHGSGYASYGPNARVVGSLAARLGRRDESERWFAHVRATREPGPWTALSALDHAMSLVGSEPIRALERAEHASGALRALGLDEWARVAEDVVVELGAEGCGRPVARRTGRAWELRHPAGSAVVDDGVGIGHLLELLQRPGHSYDVVELDGRGVGDTGPEGGVRNLDDQARRTYRRRLAQLADRSRLDEAESREIEFLRRELGQSNFTRSSSAEVERARIRVTKALRRCIAAIGDQSPALADHLERSVATGRHCIYAPPDGTPWHIER